MNRRSLLQITALAGVSLSLTGCGSELIADYNQKIRVTVITPEGEKSGSAVTHIETRLGAGKMTQSTIKGEATVVDLGQGKYLFALLSENTQRLSHIVFPDNQGKGQDPKEIPQGKVAKGVEPYSVFPLLVTFDDLNDPKSVKEVNPANLAATFGAGYSHKSTTLEITNEPVTEGGGGETTTLVVHCSHATYFH